jgi:hypothetical protein
MEQTWNSEMTSSKLHQFRSLYRNELRKLEKVLQQKQKNKQTNCQHNWVKDLSARGGRSHYDCSICNLYR